MRPILVALDASERAPVVLRAATGLARKLGAKLVALRVVSVALEIPMEAYAVSMASLPELLQREARAGLERLTASVEPGLMLGVLVEVGTPWDAICQVAKRDDCSMIVLGSHGYRGLDRILGTTAARVVNHADRTVVVVRQDALLDV
ncbi:MAG: universal stress protein [Myxococcota bacterium]